MNKATLAAAAAALLIAGSPISYAQSDTGPHAATSPATSSEAAAPQANASAANPAPGSAPSSASLGDRIQSDQLRASNIIGSTAYDAQNQDVGKVKDLVIDRDGRVAAVVVSVGSGFLGTGGKDVAVAMTDVKIENNRLTLNESKQQLQQAQNYDLQTSQPGGAAVLPPQAGQLDTANNPPPTVLHGAAGQPGSAGGENSTAGH